MQSCLIEFIRRVISNKCKLLLGLMICCFVGIGSIFSSLFVLILSELYILIVSLFLVKFMPLSNQRKVEFSQFFFRSFSL